MLAEMIEENNSGQQDSIPKAEKKEYYPMSPAQRRTFFIQQMEPDSTVYNMVRVLALRGDVRPDDIHSALQTILDRHEVLRTALLLVDGAPVQKIMENVKLDFKCFASSETNEKLASDFMKPFDLSSPPLMRAELIDKGDYWVLMFDMHHVVSDAISMNILVREFSTLYNGGTLEPVAYQYKDYSEWLNSRDITGQAEYWKNQFSDEAPVLDMPLDYPRPQMQSYSGSQIGMSTDKELTLAIKDLSKKTGTTEYMIFLSALMIMLSKYSRQEDIVIGSPISGRTHRDIENIMGMFINTLAMRAYPEKDKTYSQFLKEIKEICLNAYANQEYPFEELVEAAGVKRDISRNPLFDVMLSVYNTDSENPNGSGDMEMQAISFDTAVAKMDLSFNVQPLGDEFAMSLEYCTELFGLETANRMLENYCEVLRAITRSQEQKLRYIQMLSEDDSQKILGRFNMTDEDYPREKTVVEFLEEKADSVPESIAVKYEDKTISFKELNYKANYLGSELAKQGIGKNDFVAIIAKRSVQMIEAIYGILKCGAAYVPIDPNMPDDRIKFIVEDCGAKAIVTYGADLNFAPDISVIKYEELENKFTLTANPARIADSGDVAYVIYTSGTTGIPKGVMIEHGSLTNLVCAYEKAYEITENDVVLQFANYCFDQSVWEIFSIVKSGNSLCSIPEDYVKNPEKLTEYAEKQGVTVTLMTPTYINLLNADSLKTLRLLDSGGEAGNLETLKYWHKTGKRVLNTYGPTETTVNASSYEVTERSDKLLIGKPMANLKFYVMDDNNLCGIGVPGELCIAGDGVARGYLNRPELTDEKFVKNPFGEGRMYRSGDLARWLPDGNVECLGRMDEQVKVKGRRIELGEIKSRIREIDNITDCAVIAKADSTGDMAIYAYYVSNGRISVSEVREQLGETFPNYMIPGYIMEIASIPVTRNGKLDTKNLPDIVLDYAAEYVAPRDDFEKEICDIFGSVLGVKRVGLDDNFYNLGGDSIKAVRIVSKMRENGYKILVSDIMKYKTIGKCLSCITKTAGDVVYEQGEVTGVVGKTPILKYFESLRLAEPQHFNQSKVIDVMQADNDTLKKVLTSIVINHDMLRAVYRNGQAEILSSSESKMFDFYDLGDFTNIPLEKVSEKCTEIQASINLEEGPLVKAVVFTENGHKLLVLIIHHLAVDIMSWKILTEDFESAYKALSEGRELVYPPKTASYIEWAKALEDYKKSEDFAKNEAYWKKAADGIENYGFNSLKKEFAHPYSMLEEVFVVSKEEVLNLKESAEIFNASVLEMLFSALALAVNMISEQEKLTVAVETHGRETLHKEIMIDRTVGWFTTVYPVLLECTSDIRTLIVNNKEILRGIPKNGFDYGLIDKPEIDDSDFICFNYAGETVADEDDGGSGVSEEQTQSNMPVISGEPFSKKNIMKNNIVFNVSLQNGVLRVNIQYNSEFYSKNEIEILFENFRRALNDISDYCLSMDDSVFTASDFDSSMDNDDFENLLDLI